MAGSSVHGGDAHGRTEVLHYARLAAGVFGGARDLVDERPLDVVLAQLAGAAGPRPAAGRVHQRRERGRRGRRLARAHQEHAAGLFALGIGVVGVPIEAEEPCDRALRAARDERRPPPREPGGQPHGRDRVAEIVLTVPEGALAVLPRFAPVNRGQADEARVRRIAERRAPRRGIERRAPLERVPIGGVVEDGGAVGQAVERTGDEIGLRRVEVAARRIDAERPAWKRETSSGRTARARV